MLKAFEKDLRERERQSLLRRPKGLEGIDFSSNDCLNLSDHPKIRAAMGEALEKGLPLSGRASRLLSGTSPWHEETEALLGAFLSRQGVLSFSSGYLASIGVIPALVRPAGAAVFSDELNHASLIDGVRLSRAACHIFPHRDLGALEALLKKERGEKLIITESLFSMGGDFAPLSEISSLALKYQALLFVDEAHATGVFGPGFSGLTGHLREKEHIVSLHTGGKALGASGAFIGCSRLIKTHLINSCRSFIYTTAPPPLLMVQWKAALKVLEEEPFRPLRLRETSLRARSELSGLFPGGLEKTESHILFLPAAGPSEALEKEDLLRRRGLSSGAVRWPSVPKGKEGLRIALKYQHKREDLRRLKSALREASGCQGGGC